MATFLLVVFGYWTVYSASRESLPYILKMIAH